MISRRALLAGTGAVAAVTRAEAQSPQQRPTTMKIIRNGSQASRKGPAENFIGAVRVDMPFQRFSRFNEINGLSEI